MGRGEKQIPPPRAAEDRNPWVGMTTGGDIDRMRTNKTAKTEERFLTAQANTFAGANVKEKALACSVRNDNARGAGGGKAKREIDEGQSRFVVKGSMTGAQT